jgi:hypothetical protein
MLLILASFLMMALPLFEVLVEPLPGSSRAVEHSAQGDGRRDDCCHAGEAG